jgi:hypothetical protein
VTVSQILRPKRPKGFGRQVRNNALHTVLPTNSKVAFNAGNVRESWGCTATLRYWRPNLVDPGLAGTMPAREVQAATCPPTRVGLADNALTAHLYARSDLHFCGRHLTGSQVVDGE